ncbi:MAG: hypothetical protein IPG04_05225 [Polyangiaceae bacterium]|nr:hypothetical protein [Polyangiaceae bacterium]
MSATSDDGPLRVVHDRRHLRGGAACDAAVETYAGNSYGQCDPPTCFNN